MVFIDEESTIKNKIKIHSFIHSFNMKTLTLGEVGQLSQGHKVSVRDEI